MNYSTIEIAERTLLKLYLFAILKPKTNRFIHAILAISNKSAVHKNSPFHIIKLYMGVHMEV